MVFNKIISIIVPVRNSENTLSECLLSILNNEYKNFEVIVVDNNSNDNSKNIITDFVKKDNRFKYVFENKTGRGKARNKGLNYVKNEIILMTDSDCVVPKYWITEMIKPIINENENIVMGYQENCQKNYFSVMEQNEDLKRTNIKSNSKYINNLDTKNFAAKKSILQEYRFDENLKAMEDWDLYIRLKYKGIKIRFLRDIKVKHYYNNSVYSLYKTQKERGFFAFQIKEKYKKNRKYLNILKEEENYKSIKFINFIFFIPWSILQLIKNPKNNFYVVLSDFFWKIGLIKGFFSK